MFHLNVQDDNDDF